MCGITGFLGKGDLSILQMMTRKLAKRGPDAETFWYEPSKGSYFGHRRLSIIDIEGGNQPMISPDGRYVLVFNGAIYNSPELRKELEKQGARFKSDHSDTEVLLHAYINWGSDMLPRLNGMWAFSIFDCFKNKLFCSRDRFGQKPFYYFLKKGVFAFSSQLDSLLLHPDAPNTLDQLSLQKYMAYSYVPEPATLFSGVKKIPAGCYLEYDFNQHSCQVRSFWRFQIRQDQSHANLDDLVEELKVLLHRAVRRRLLSDVPLGVFLSGGLDSSIISYLAKKESHLDPKCFAISFPQPGFDESPFARAAASHLGLDLHVNCITPEEARIWSSKILDEIDDPIGDSSLIPTFLLCRDTVNHVKVALGGDGADELFAGYAPFLALKKASFYSRFVPDKAHQLFKYAVACLPVSHDYMSLNFKLKKVLGGLDYPQPMWLPVWMSALSQSDLKDLFHQPVEFEELFADAIKIWDDCQSPDPVDRALSFFTRMYLSHAILHKVDRAGMMNGLEVRSPFLDVEVAEFAMKLPARFKLNGNVTKYILRHAFSDVLPPEILKRSKHGFALPVGAWLQSGQIPEEQNHLKDVNSVAVEKKWENHRKNRSDERLVLWNLLSLNRNRLVRETGALE